MRRTILLAGVLLSVVALGWDSPKEYDDRTEDIQGTWQRTEFEFNGEKVNPPIEEVMIIRDGSETSKYSDRIHRCSYRIDPTRMPHHIDWITSSGPSKGATYPGIYRIDGDTLRIAWITSDSDGRRPKGFSDKDIRIASYKRVK